MARPVREITEKDSSRYNTMRANHLQESYTYEELQEIFRKNDFPGDWNFIKALTWGDNPPLHKVTRKTEDGKERIYYRFHDKPLFVERLKNAYKEYRKKASAKITVKLSNETKMRVENAGKIETPQSQPQQEEKDVIELAIELLKSEGYRIYKPKPIEYEEI
jgi:hypothetical protein